LLARGLHQDPDYIPSSNRALSNTAYAIGVLGSIAQDEGNSRDCMEALGWEQRRNDAASRPTAATATAVAEPVALTAPQPTPIPIPAAASVSVNPPSPAAAVVSGIAAVAETSAPAPEGQVVLFPVTIYNPYHPHWTVGQ
jgi:hypothetical protein